MQEIHGAECTGLIGRIGRIGRMERVGEKSIWLRLGDEAPPGGITGRTLLGFYR